MERPVGTYLDLQLVTYELQRITLYCDGVAHWAQHRITTVQQ